MTIGCRCVHTGLTGTRRTGIRYSKDPVLWDKQNRTMATIKLQSQPLSLSSGISGQCAVGGAVHTRCCVCVAAALPRTHPHTSSTTTNGHCHKAVHATGPIERWVLESCVAPTRLVPFVSYSDKESCVAITSPFLSYSDLLVPVPCGWGVGRTTGSATSAHNGD
jgi:hypothetical protein